VCGDSHRQTITRRVVVFARTLLCQPGKRLDAESFPIN
jgi:hypothetical protein